MLTGMTSTTTAIADKVRGVAAEKRFTQQRIAEVLGISRTQITERYQGRVPFTATEIFTLAEALDVPLGRLFPDVAERAA